MSELINPLNLPNTEIEKRCLEREGILLASINRSMNYYSRSAKRARSWHRFTGVVLLFCAVLAPVAVVSTTGHDTGLGVFGVDQKLIVQIAVAITIVLALVEGLRRIFQFEHRWILCIRAREDLRQLRDAYLDEQLSNKIGSSNWLNKMHSLRNAVFQVHSQEEGAFFEKLKAPRENAEHSHGE